MELTYKSSEYCEFTILALIDKWEMIGDISAYKFASEHNISMDLWWSFYSDYKAIKAKK